MAKQARSDAAAEAERRRDDFHYGFGQPGDFATDVLRDCLIGTHGFVSRIVGSEPADAGFNTIVGAFFESDVERLGWKEALWENDGMLYSELPMGQRFHDLAAYAYQGVALNGGETAEEREDLLRRLMEGAEAFVASVPYKLWSIAGDDLARIMLLARGRWALDHDEPIEVPALALFGGVTERRIRNMISKTEGALPNEGGKVPARAALDWLRHRPKSFRPSVWREQNTWTDLPGLEPQMLSDVYFVPVAPDGSMFHSGLARDGGYRIGDGKEDEVVADFDAALERLQKMVTPVWRRPTPQGLWTRVRGSEWRRITAEELEALGSSPPAD